LEYNKSNDINKAIQIPKNQYEEFVERLGPSKANSRLNLIQKQRTNQKD